MSDEETGVFDRLPAVPGRKGEWFRFEHEAMSFVFWVDNRPDSIQDYIVRTGGFYELEALQLMRDILPPKARIIDVGANIGNHAIYFDRICGAGRVFVIEPNPDVIDDLKANAAANGCEAIDFSQTGFAVGSEAGVGSLFLSASDDAIRNRGGLSISRQAGSMEQVVPIRRLDDLDLGEIDFIKIDVEGNALAVLEGARSLIARCRPEIFVEIDIPDVPAFAAWLGENGYTIAAAVQYHFGILNFLLVPNADSATRDGDTPARRHGAAAARGGKYWSAMLAEKRRAERSEETLAIAVTTMRNADARATAAEASAAASTEKLTAAVTEKRDANARALAAEARAADATERLTVAVAAMHAAEARATAAETRAADAQLLEAQAARRAADAEERANSLDARAPDDAVLVPAQPGVPDQSATPRGFWRRLFFRRSGRPKKFVRRLLFHSSGRPRGELKRYIVHPDGRPRDAFRQWMTSPEYLAMPDSIRAAKVRSRDLAQTAQAQLAAREPFQVPRPPSRRTLFSRGPKRVLFIDSDYPDPDRDSGSIDAINYVSWLVALGYNVVFLSTGYRSNAAAERPVTSAGAQVLHLESEQAVVDFLRDEGDAFAMFFLSRIHCGGRFLEACRRGNPRADIVFNTVDLHFVREERAAKIRVDREGYFRAQTIRERELYVVRQSDLILVVSSLEKDIVLDSVPGAPVQWMPLFRALPPRVSDFASRSGIGFVGGYSHAPNVDAVRYFLEEVWPQVHSLDPGIRFEIAGLGLPDDIVQSLPSGVIYRGQVADLEQWLGRLRLTVAPLRYGAGAKGKVASSIVNGVPVIGTRVAFEGMGIGSEAAITTDGSSDMASAIVRIHSDKVAWEALSRGSRDFAVANLSIEAGMKRFTALLAELPGVSATSPSTV